MKILLLIILLLIAAIGNSQDLTSEMKQQVLSEVIENIEKKYVFPETGAKMNAYLKTKMRNNEYDKINNKNEFAETLTKDLISVSKDKHVNVSYSPNTFKQYTESIAKNESEEELNNRMKSELLKNNFTFKKVEILSGNIGYIKFNMFAPIKLSKNVIDASLKFIENTDAVIFDLRDNGGGDPETVQYICSHFFGNTPILLNSLYFREGDKTDDFYTISVPGLKRENVPIYVLTSPFTFSGAEEFAYNIQTQKRGTIIGETTGGGANPNAFVPVSNGFMLSVSIGKAINPVTKTNWEGVGVVPDINVPTNSALDKAHLEALKKISETDPENKAALWMIDILSAKLNPFSITPEEASEYAGSFGERMIKMENGRLIYKRGNNPEKNLVPLSKDVFMLEGIDYVKMQFDRDSSGRIVSITGIYDNGMQDKSLKQ